MGFLLSVAMFGFSALYLTGALALTAIPPREFPPLLDHEGRPFSFSRLGQKTVVLNFIFTHCPSSCPIQTKSLVDVQAALPKSVTPRVQFVSVTMDPARDSAHVLKRYAKAMQVDFQNWTFLTGEDSIITQMQQHYESTVPLQGDSLMHHAVRVYLLDAKGRVMQKYTGQIDKPRLIREIRQVDSLFNPL
jgi:protein SCO1